MRLSIEYFEEELNEKTAVLTKGFDTIVPFVNDKISRQTIDSIS